MGDYDNIQRAEFWSKCNQALILNRIEACKYILYDNFSVYVRQSQSSLRVAAKGLGLDALDLGPNPGKEGQHYRSWRVIATMVTSDISHISLI